MKTNVRYGGGGTLLNKKGFTLVELLSVIVILGIIALIAVPLILNVIEESRLSSLKLSTKNYIRAVETAIVAQRVENKVKDGLYTIDKKGKVITLDGYNINIDFDGNSIESGMLLIEDGKVKRIIKGKIKDYYARIEQDEIKLYKNIDMSILFTGAKFNKAIKTLVNKEEISYNKDENLVEHITFLPEGLLPEEYTKEDLEAMDNVVVSQDDDSIKAYYDGFGNVYILSDNIISVNKDSSQMFRQLTSLKDITFNLLDTSISTSMSSIFYGCTGLTKLNLTHFDTSKVTFMNSMFYGCKSLTDLNLSSFDTHNVTTMESMFYNCTNLADLNLSGFNTSKVTTMQGMFTFCYKLKGVDLETFNTSQVTSMRTMFYGCTNLKELDLSSFDTSKVTDMSYMFNGCKNLTELDLTHFNTSRVINMGNMFSGCSGLTELDLSNFDTHNVTEMLSMFEGASSLIELDLSNFDTSSLKLMGVDSTYWSYGGMFHNCTNLKKLDLSNWNTSQVTSMYMVFNGLKNLEELDLSSFEIPNLKNVRSMFGNSNIKLIDLRNADFTQVEGYNSMFNTANAMGTIIVKDQANKEWFEARLSEGRTTANIVIA